MRECDGRRFRKNNQIFPETNFLLWMESFDQWRCCLLCLRKLIVSSEATLPSLLLVHYLIGVRRRCVAGGDTKDCSIVFSESVKSETHDWASDEINKLRFLSCTAIVSILHVNGVCEM